LSRSWSIDERIECASTLPSAFYKDPAVYRDCLELLFARSWQFVGDTDTVRVPGAVCPFTLLEGSLNEPMVITRDMHDRVHLLSNVCTHRGMQVVEGCGNERFLRCRYHHGRRYGLDGKFQHMPEFETACDFPSERDDLPRVSSGLWDKLLFASIDPVAPIHEVLEPVLNRVGWMPIRDAVHNPSRSRDYLVRANWALYVDNYLEGFHIPFVHASLNAVLDYGSYSSELFKHGSLQLAVGSGGEHGFDLPKDSPDHGRFVSAYYFWIFPNTMLNFYPWGLSVNVVKPLGPDLTKVSFIAYVWDASKLDEGAGSNLDRVEREDEAVVELVNRGVQSRLYDRGRYSPTRERNVHHFHRIIAAKLSLNSP
jgi:choline monooxygenase